MIPLKAIADLIQEKLGAAYKVDIDNYPDVDAQQIPVVLYASRIPYAVDNDIEALSLRLEFDAITTTTQDKKYHNDNIADLFNAINGVKYKIEGNNNKSYYVKFYMQSNEPLGTRIDGGHFVTMYSITGSALVTASNTVFADDKIFFINGQKMTVISYTVDMSMEHTQVSANSIEQKCIPKSRGRIYSFVFLLDNSAVSTALESEINGGGSDVLENIYELTIRKSTGLDITREVILINGKDSGSIGGFATITATFKARS